MGLKGWGEAVVPFSHPDGRLLYWEPASFVAFSTDFAGATPTAQANQPPLTVKLSLNAAIRLTSQGPRGLANAIGIRQSCQAWL